LQQTYSDKQHCQPRTTATRLFFRRLVNSMILSGMPRGGVYIRQFPFLSLVGSLIAPQATLP